VRCSSTGELRQHGGVCVCGGGGQGVAGEAGAGEGGAGEGGGVVVNPEPCRSSRRMVALVISLLLLCSGPVSATETCCVLLLSLRHRHYLFAMLQTHHLASTRAPNQPGCSAHMALQN